MFLYLFSPETFGYTLVSHFDEFSTQLINNQGKFVAKIGAKDVHVLAHRKR
jgi:hypothetical protein